MTATMEEKALFDDVFCLPHGDAYILYLPLRGVVLSGNKSLVNALARARDGGPQELAKLGLDARLLGELFASRRIWERLTSTQNLPEFRPQAISLFLTGDCTLRCRYCYAEGGSTRREMPWDMAAGILDRVLENVLTGGASKIAVHFHGGGDLGSAWPLFVRTREYLDAIAKPRGVEIVTSAGLNGYLKANQLQWIIEHIDSATVSLDGPPDIQDYLRPAADGSPSFPVVSGTLRAFDKARFPYGIRTTVTSTSVNRLAETVAFICENFQARQIKIEPMYPRGRSQKTKIATADADAFIFQFREARRIARRFGRELLYSGVRLETLTATFCRAAGDSCAVTPDGNVTSCYEVISAADPLAKVFFYGRFDPAEKAFVIDGDRRRELFNLNVFNRSQCDRCFCKWHCAGDCPVKTLHRQQTGDPAVPDRCRINRALTKDLLLEILNGEA